MQFHHEYKMGCFEKARAPRFLSPASANAQKVRQDNYCMRCKGKSYIQLLKSTLNYFKKVPNLKKTNLNFHFNVLINSNLSHVFSPARFVLAEVQARMTDTTPCSVGCAALFFEAFVACATRRTTALDCA